MENKKIRFPVASIFFILYAVIDLASFAYLVILVISEGLSSSDIPSFQARFLVPTILMLASCIFAAIVLLQKKLNKTLFIATIPFVVLYLYYLITGFSVRTVLNFVAFLLLALIVGTTSLPQLSDYKNIAKKLFFLPAVLLFISVVTDLLSYIRYSEISYFFTDNLSWFLIIPAVFFFAFWCVNPYASKQAPAEAAQSAVQPGAPQAGYDDAYCSLGKHIVLCLFTFGIWPLIWIYRTTAFLNQTPNSEQYNPTNKLLLCMFVPFYSIYWLYKHGQKIDDFSKAKGLNNSDMATLCLILGIFIPLVAYILMQDRINAICTAKTAPAANTAAAPAFDPNELPEL